MKVREEVERRTAKVKKEGKKKEYDGREREKKETAHTSFPASNPDSHHIVVNTFV